MGTIRRDDLVNDDNNEDIFEHQRILVDGGQEPLRVDKFLMNRLDRVSRNRVQLAIETGAIQVNGTSTKSNYKVKPRDEISILLPRDPEEPYEIVPENIPLEIIYEDDAIMLINKPAGLVVHPGVGNASGTLVNAILYYFKSKNLPLLNELNPDRPGLVHRLDKDTSGIMIIAKTEYAMTHLAKQFFYHTITRKYESLVWGNLDPQEGTIEGYIGRHLTERMKMHVFTDPELGKKAITHYKVLSDFYYVSHVECQLETGRTHQIRVHMNSIGHTVFNDARYGGDLILKGTIYTKYKQFVQNCFELCPRQALHAKVLGFIHPITENYMYFEQPMPADMEALLQKWKMYYETKSGNIDRSELADESEMKMPSDIKRKN